jgi:hypothetical protein
MTFKNIQADTNCDCLNGANIDTENEYVRRLRKETVVDKDFQTHWERGIRPEIDNCENICSYKGVSINQFRNEFVEQILNKYKTTFSINPKKGAFYLKFKLTKDAGKVKFASEEDDNSHYNFFKADNFDLNSLVILDTVKFI